MPWNTDYAPDTAEIRFTGETTGDEIREAKKQFFSHAFEREPRYVLCDFTAVEKFRVSPADVKRIVDQDRDAARVWPGLAEVVVAPTMLEYGSSRMWQFLVDDVRPRTRVGRIRAEVLEWLAEQGVELTPEHRHELAESRKREA